MQHTLVCLSNSLCHYYSVACPCLQLFGKEISNDWTLIVKLTVRLRACCVPSARKLSLVGELPGANVKSHAGYLTVNKKYNSNLFFWFFPALEVSRPSPRGHTCREGKGTLAEDEASQLIPLHLLWRSPSPSSRAAVFSSFCSLITEPTCVLFGQLHHSGLIVNFILQPQHRYQYLT